MIAKLLQAFSLLMKLVAAFKIQRIEDKKNEEVQQATANPTSFFNAHFGVQHDANSSTSETRSDSNTD